MKRATLAKCGSCDLALPDSEVETNGTLWCHGAPPHAHEIVGVEMIDNKPVEQRRLTGLWPPVSKGTSGCALHPQVRKKLGLSRG